MPSQSRPSPWSLILAFEVTAGTLLTHRAPFDPGRLVFSAWLRGVRVPGLASGLGGTVVERADSSALARAPGQGPYRGSAAAIGEVRDVALPVEAFDTLGARLRATGLPERTPNVRGRVDTSDRWIAHRLSLVWDDLPPVQLVAHAMSSGYEGPDAAAVEALFEHLVALGRGAATR